MNKMTLAIVGALLLALTAGCAAEQDQLDETEQASTIADEAAVADTEEARLAREQNRWHPSTSREEVAESCIERGEECGRCCYLAFSTDKTTNECTTICTKLTLRRSVAGKE